MTSTRSSSTTSIGRLKKEKIENVKLKLVTSDDPLLEPGSVDTIFMVDVYHYIENRVEYAKKLRAAPRAGRPARDHRLHPEEL